MSVRDVTTDARMIPAAEAIWSTMEMARDGVESMIRGLTPEQLRTRPEGFHNSIAALVCHIGASSVFFAHLVTGGEAPKGLLQELYADRRGKTLFQPDDETAESLTAKLRRAQEEVRAALLKLQPEDLGREVQGMGTTFTGRWALSLLAHHFSWHAGQIRAIIPNVT